MGLELFPLRVSSPLLPPPLWEESSFLGKGGEDGAQAGPCPGQSATATAPACGWLPRTCGRGAGIAFPLVPGLRCTEVAAPVSAVLTDGLGLGCSASSLGEALALSEPRSGQEGGRVCVKQVPEGQAAWSFTQRGPHRLGMVWAQDCGLPAATSPLVLAVGRSERGLPAPPAVVFALMLNGFDRPGYF